MPSNTYNGITVSFMISSICVLVFLAVQGNVSGYTGKEIALKLANAEFIPQNDTGNYQIKINVNYSVLISWPDS
jgi:hypothetical protein